jgi:dienelactone hydrolase
MIQADSGFRLPPWCPRCGADLKPSTSDAAPAPEPQEEPPVSAPPTYQEPFQERWATDPERLPAWEHPPQRHKSAQGTAILLIGAVFSGLATSFFVSRQLAQTRDKLEGPAATGKPADLEPLQLPPAGPGLHAQATTMPNGDTLLYTVSVPKAQADNRPLPLIVALHYGGNATPHFGRGVIKELVEPAFAELGAVIIAPDALAGGDWTSAKNEQAVVWLTRSVMKSYPIDPEKVLLTGFSMGGQGAWYLGGRHQDLFTAVLPVAGEPAGDTREWKVPVYVLHSENDRVLRLEPTQRHVEQLKAQGANVELKVVKGLTHYQTERFATPLKEALPWLRQVWQ